MSANVFDYILLCASILSATIYVFVLITIYCNRHKPPLNTAFFTISLSLGINDLAQLIKHWTLIKCPAFQWFHTDELLLQWQAGFAKITSFLGWSLTMSQALGIAFLALNRVTVVAYDIKWNSFSVKIAIVVHWLLPVALNIPQLFMGFGYHKSNETGGIVHYWLNHDAQFFYFSSCIAYVVLISLICLISYTLTFCKLHQHSSTTHHITTSTNSLEIELKLAFVGFVLFILTCLYGVWAGYMAFQTDPEVVGQLFYYQFFVGDVYCWINAYLLLACSRHLRIHFYELFSKASKFTPAVSWHRGDTQTEHQQPVDRPLIRQRSRTVT